LILLAFSCAVAAGAEQQQPDQAASRRLAVELIAEKRHEPAAIEFRRMALLAAAEPRDAAACYWAAAYEYLQARDYMMTGRMLDLAESISYADGDRMMLLRGEAAIAGGRHDEAAYYMEGLLAGNGTPEQKSYASFRLARALVAQRQTDKALATLAAAGRPAEKEAKAVSTYAKGRDRRPWVGGLLGTIPGLGHFYSGQYSSGFRALLINALFIYGMVETADAEAWGGFAVITFFEITWYSGSIYGGVDAAHRFNRNRMEECLRTIDEGASMRPDLSAVPAITLKYEF
jgi:tetratricopeptide (TPR) repeat protein